MKAVVLVLVLDDEKVVLMVLSMETDLVQLKEYMMVH